ncbi:MAG: hypothetical protein JXR95_08600 [Deltaproteobacteria bacterium]|nr:hypothetical protein [Deltaproteobacteria bacterium]
MSVRHLLLILVFFIGCTDLDKKKTLHTLEGNVLQFYEQARWGRGNLAKEYVVPSGRIKFLDDLDLLLKKIKISEINVIRITPYKKNSKAAVRLRIKWLNEDEGILNETLVEDTWIQIKNIWLRDKCKVIDGKKLPSIFK